MCLQEAAEDFLIDFMNDGYIAAAFAHRITLMSKDFVLVSRLRYKFDKALEPIPSQDMRAFEILNIPPARQPKQSVVIEDISHPYDTRKAQDIKEEVEKEREQEKISEDALLSQQAEILHSSNSELYKNVTGQMIVDVSMPGEDEVYCDIAPEDTSMLVNPNIEISDTIVLICLRFVGICFCFLDEFPRNHILLTCFVCVSRCLMRDLHESMAVQVTILDPLVTQCLFNRQGDLASFLKNFDMLTCNYIVYPYVEV